MGIIALAATFFAHPLGLGIATFYELIRQLPYAMHSGEAFLNCLHHAAYLGVLMLGSIEIISVGLLLNMAMEALKAKGEWRKGHVLETIAHLLMSGVRFGQSLPIMAEKHTSIRPLANTVAAIRDRTSSCLYKLARTCITPMWTSTNLWLTTISLCKNRKAFKYQTIASIFSSTIITLALLPFTLAGVAAGHILHFAAFLMATKPFTHLIGKGSKELKKQLSIFQLNCCLTAGGFAKLFGGLALSDKERLAKISEMILNQDPDIIALQEVSDPSSAFALYETLKDKYHDFYLNMGTTPWILQNNSGLFLASKIPVTSARFESFEDIPGTETMVNKGYFTCRLKDLTIINTHLSPSSDDYRPSDSEINARNEEQKRILNEKPNLVLADFNTFQGPLFDKAAATISSTSCETDYLRERNFNHNPDFKPNEHLFIDHALSFGPSLKGKTIATFDTDNPAAAISDHPAILSSAKI